MSCHLTLDEQPLVNMPGKSPVKLDKSSAHGRFSTAMFVLSGGHTVPNKLPTKVPVREFLVGLAMVVPF